MWHGALLLFLGLLTGLLVPALRNPRMGVSAHLEALMNGFFLLILGIVWKELRLSARAATATFRIALFGTYMNWGFTLLGGAFGTSRLTPIAGSGFIGEAWQEAFVAAGLVPLVLAMIVCSVLVLIGLSGPSRE